MLQVGLIADAVGAPDHGHFRAVLQPELWVGNDRSHRVHEVGRVLAPREEADTERIAQVFVQHRRTVLSLEGSGDGFDRFRRCQIAPEDQELHEKPAVEQLWLAVTLGATFAGVNFLQSRAVHRWWDTPESLARRLATARNALT